MNLDPTDSFYQQLDSEDLLKRHGRDLVREAGEVLRKRPRMRVAGLIATQDSNEAGPLRGNLRGEPRPSGPLTAIIARRDVEPLVTKIVGTEPWLEPAGEPQRALPVIVATRDGYRFGFFGLGPTAGDPGLQGS